MDHPLCTNLINRPSLRQPKLTLLNLLLLNFLSSRIWGRFSLATCTASPN